MRTSGGTAARPVPQTATKARYTKHLRQVGQIVPKHRGDCFELCSGSGACPMQVGPDMVLVQTDA